MNPNIPAIDQLKELGLPAPVSYAPQTWGWWVLLVLLIAGALLLSARHYLQWRRDRYRREALARLAQLRSRSDDLSALRELPELLKRVALSMPNSLRRNTTPVGRPAHPTSTVADLTPSLASQLPQEPAVSAQSLFCRSCRRLRSLAFKDQKIAAFGSSYTVAAVGGKQWQDFLVRHCRQPLPADFSAQLALLAYAPDATLQALSAERRQQLFDTCQRWVEQHHVAA